MKREEYKSTALNYSVQYAAYLRNVIVAGWNPEQIKAFTESLLNEMDETASSAIEDKDLDRFDYVCVREYFDNLREGIERATAGMVEYLEATDELF